MTDTAFIKNNQIKVLHDKVLLEPITPETESSLILPEGAAAEIREPIAHVIGIGTHEDIKVEIGDKVCFDPSPLLQLKVEGKEYMLIPYRSIIAVLGKRDNND